MCEVQRIASRFDEGAIERLATLIADTRERGGRLFVLGVGASAANASQAVEEFRRNAGIESYSPACEEGQASALEGWLKTSRLRPSDTVLVLSTGASGDANIDAAVGYTKKVGASIGGILGRDGGFAATVADVCVLIPVINAEHATPHSEAFQSIIWHLLVCHPVLKRAEKKWDSVRPCDVLSRPSPWTRMAS